MNSCRAAEIEVSTVEVVSMAKSGLGFFHKGKFIALKDIQCEWAGPLQPTNENEPGETQEGREGT